MHAHTEDNDDKDEDLLQHKTVTMLKYLQANLVGKWGAALKQLFKRCLMSLSNI